MCAGAEPQRAAGTWPPGLVVRTLELLQVKSWDEVAEPVSQSDSCFSHSSPYLGGEVWAQASPWLPGARDHVTAAADSCERGPAQSG